MFIVLTAAVLIHFGQISEIIQHGIDRTGICKIAFPDDVLHLYILPRFLHLFELCMRVENKCCIIEAPRRTAAMRVHPDDEKCLLFQAEAKVLRTGIGHHSFIIRVQYRIPVGQGLQALPHQLVEHFFAVNAGLFEDDGRGIKNVSTCSVIIDEVVQEVENGRIIFWASHVIRHEAGSLLPRHRLAGGNAGKLRLCKECVVELVQGFMHGGKGSN